MSKNDVYGYDGNSGSEGVWYFAIKHTESENYTNLCFYTIFFKVSFPNSTDLLPIEWSELFSACSSSFKLHRNISWFVTFSFQLEEIQIMVGK